MNRERAALLVAGGIGALAVGVAAVAVVVTAAGGPDDARSSSGSNVGSSTAAQATPGPTRQKAFVGKRWRLASVDHEGRRQSVPAALDATLQFGTSGTIALSDTVNHLSGRYTPTTTGFVTSDVMTTLIGYTGTDEPRRTVVTALDALVAPSAAPQADLVEGRLLVTVAGFDLTFDPDGDAVEPAAEPSATRPVPSSS